MTVTELMYESLGKLLLRYLLPSLWIRPWSDQRLGLGVGLGLGLGLGIK